MGLREPGVVHWDDVPFRRVETGGLRASWQDLGRAAGSRSASVKREVIEPGYRPTPAHSHGTDEEFFFVLSGGGLSWQDGVTHEVGPGDVLLHRPAEAAHTLIAGDDGLEVLVFGPEAQTSASHLPRAGVFWLGPWWTSSPGGPRPFEREPEEIEGEPGERPPTTVHYTEAELHVLERGKRRLTERLLGDATGSTTTGMGYCTIAAGHTGYPLHCHSVEEELFVVLAGEGVVVIGETEHAVRRGSVIARPPATRIPHAFRAGDEPLEYLAWGTRDPSDICFYPDSNKISIRGVGVIGRIERLDYWDGEDI